ncbi:TolC family protein [Flavobacterium sp.]|uniref:TolC family protein n=1 Tax=Flavobacterium sp. TaxID=239 RepID=UPI00403496BF
MKHFIYIILITIAWQTAHSQQLQQLSFNEYLGYVKKYHPVVRQANLQISGAQAGLMAARGAFDPKIEVDYDKKEFKGTEYYSLLNSSFKIPTWYGIELKAAFDNSEGIYVNPQNTTPNRGLTSLGISIPLAQGLLINNRMADLRKAKVQLQLSEAERKLQVTHAIYEASIAYFNWKRAYSEVQLYDTYLKFASDRYSGIRKLIEAGDKPAIDSVEAGITVKNRRLTLTEAQLKLAKARLDLSNFLWLDDVPLELSQDVVPEDVIEAGITQALGIDPALEVTDSLDGHPKVLALQGKVDILDIDRRYKANLLLPRVDLSYNYLSEPSYIDNYRLEDYKIGFNFSFPLFLRKERGALKLAKIKVQDGMLDLDLARLEIKNKLIAQRTEIASLADQRKIADELVNDYTSMLQSEERLFSFGESSIFLINARENNVVSAKLSQIALQNRFLGSNAELFRILGEPGN